VGFDWPDAQQVRAKVLEELHEMDAALAAATDAGGVAEELGDLLFSHRELEPAPEARRGSGAAGGECQVRTALCAHGVTRRARGLDLKGLSAAEWDAMWREAKLNRT